MDDELVAGLVPCYTEAVKWLCRLGGASFIYVCMRMCVCVWCCLIPLHTTR